jgi:hypothetical protein
MGGDGITRRGFLQHAGAGLALSAAACAAYEPSANLVLVRRGAASSLRSTDLSHLALRGIGLPRGAGSREVTVAALAEHLHASGYRVGHFATDDPATQAGVAEAACEFLREHRGASFFLDYRVGPERTSPGGGVGRLLDTLRELGLAGTTAVVAVGPTA